MKTYKHNGEYWYEDDRSAWQRIVEWIIWLGGVRGSLRNVSREVARRPSLWFTQITPVSFLGHRVVVYHWGAELKTSEGRLVVVWRSGGERTLYAFVSRNGTPQGAHEWIVGAPKDVVTAAAVSQAQRDARRSTLS